MLLYVSTSYRVLSIVYLYQLKVLIIHTYSCVLGVGVLVGGVQCRLVPVACVRGLHSQPFFRDKTRLDWRALPELPRP